MHLPLDAGTHVRCQVLDQPSILDGIVIAVLVRGAQRVYVVLGAVAGADADGTPLGVTFVAERELLDIGDPRAGSHAPAARHAALRNPLPLLIAHSAAPDDLAVLQTLVDQTDGIGWVVPPPDAVPFTRPGPLVISAAVNAALDAEFNLTEK